MIPSAENTETLISKDRGKIFFNGTKKSILILGESILFIIILIINLSPLVWGILTSLKPNRILFKYPPQFIFTPTLEHFIVVARNEFFKVFLNSAMFCAASVIIGLILALIAGYSFQRYDFRFKKILFFLVIAGIPLSIGSAALVIPNYLYFSSIGMINKWNTLIVLFTAYNLPMAIWINRGGIENIPYEIEEAAMIDGASKTYILFRIIAVLNRPSMAAAALFIFIGAWNAFIIVMVMVDSPQFRTIQVAIYKFLGFFGTDWGPLMAATTLALVPTLIVFTFLGRLLISGLTQGSVKG